MFAGIQIAHICFNDDDIPKALFPNNNKAGTIRPIKGPAIYQGQGCFKYSIKSIDKLVYCANIGKCSYFVQSGG